MTRPGLGKCLRLFIYPNEKYRFIFLSFGTLIHSNAKKKMILKTGTIVYVSLGCKDRTNPYTATPFKGDALANRLCLCYILSDRGIILLPQPSGFSESDFFPRSSVGFSSSHAGSTGLQSRNQSVTLLNTS